MDRIVAITVYPGGGIDCLDDNCPLARECANHRTAGEFRGEGGLTPLLTIKSLDSKVAMCQGAEVALGAQIINKQGQLVFPE